MPRYKPSEVRAVTGEAVQYQAEAQMFGTIESKMNEWTNFLYKKGATIATAKGKEQGTMDAMQGKVKIEDDNNILGNTFYDEAYKDAAYTAYGIQTELDASNYAELAKLQANGDPEAYKSSFDKYQTTIMSEAPNDHMRAIASQSFQKYGMKGYVAIQKERIDRVNKQNEESYKSGVKLLEDQIVEAYSYGRNDEALKISSQLASLHNRGIEQGWTNENSAMYQAKELQKSAIKGKMFEDFRQSKDKIKTINEVRNSTQLDEAERQKVVDAMHKQMKSQNDDYKIANEKDEESRKLFTANIKKKNYSELVKGTLDQKDLDYQLEKGFISLSDYDELSERSKTGTAHKTDSEEYLRIYNNIDSYSVEGISKSKKLSSSDRLKLLGEKEKRETMLENEAEKEGKWDLTMNGKQANKELKNYFGIMEGTIMDKLDMNNDNMRDYTMLQSQVFDEIQSLPVEQRSSKSLQIVRKTLSDYDDGKIIGTSKHKKAKEAEKKKQQDSDNALMKEKQEDIKGKNKFMDFMGGMFK